MPEPKYTITVRVPADVYQWLKERGLTKTITAVYREAMRHGDTTGP